MSGRRRRREADNDDLIGLETGGGGHHQKLLDPHAALPGAIKQVSSQAPAEPDALERAKEQLRRQYRVFLTQYRLEINAGLFDKNGVEYDSSPMVRALAKVFKISEEQAELQQWDLHAQMVEASKGVSISELMRRHGLSPEARVNLLAHHANSPDPKVSIVAIRVANDMDDSSSAGAADSFEDWLDIAAGG